MNPLYVPKDDTLHNCMEASNEYYCKANEHMDTFIKTHDAHELEIANECLLSAENCLRIANEHAKRRIGGTSE